MLQGVAGAAVQYLGYTPGVFIVGLFAILMMWMYANFWITGTLLIIGGMLLFLDLWILKFIIPMTRKTEEGKHACCSTVLYNVFIKF